MLDKQLFNDLSDRLAALLPAANGLRDDARNKIEQILKKGLNDLDLLTREEFEGQAQALKRAEQRIAELETVLNELEARISEDASAKS